MRACRALRTRTCLSLHCRTKLLKEAASKISYLKIVSPHRLILAGSEGSAGRATKKHFVFRDGSLQEGSGKQHDKSGTVSGYTGSNLDPEAVARHIKNVRRMHFMDRN